MARDGLSQECGISQPGLQISRDAIKKLRALRPREFIGSPGDGGSPEGDRLVELFPNNDRRENVIPRSDDRLNDGSRSTSLPLIAAS